MRRAYLWGAGALASAAMCACFSFGDLTGTAQEDGGTSDAAFDAPSDASPSDAAPNDATTPTDAQSSPCVGAEHFFCDDFERDSGLTDFPFWDNKLVIGDASVIVSSPTPAPPSPPNALATVVANGSTAHISFTRAVTGSGLHCEFDILIAGSTAPFGSYLGVVSLNAAAGNYRLEPFAKSALGGNDGIETYGALADGGTFNTFFNHALPRDSWTHFAMDLSFGPAGHAKVFVNGVDTGYSAPVDVTSLGTPASGGLEIGLIAGAGDGGGANSAAFDSAFCDVIP